MTLSDVFNNNKDIIINSDLDGFLSGMILQEYYECNIVGFSNSEDKVWVDDSVKSIYDPVYIDMYVSRSDVVCIENHVIAADKADIPAKRRLMAYFMKTTGVQSKDQSKINPNLYNVSREATFYEDYAKKYPFGTVHYLIALMEKDGIKVNLGRLNKTEKITKGVRTYTSCPGQIVLRADDALYSSLGPYKGNCKEWWDWLKGFGSSTITELCDFIGTLNPSKNSNYKMKVEEFLKDGLGSDDVDGGFFDVVDSGGNILNSVSEFINELSRIMGIGLVVPRRMHLHKGNIHRELFRNNPTHRARLNRILSNPELFSYSFVFGPNTRRSINFSYTTNMI